MSDSHGVKERETPATRSAGLEAKTDSATVRLDPGTPMIGSLPYGAPVQRARTADGGGTDVHRIASGGLSGPAGQLPYLNSIQASFGRHDVSKVQAHTAPQANRALGSLAYTAGGDVAFASSTPDLRTAAHEAAHVVQQQGGVRLSGGVGRAGDAYERHADAVADRVVAGESAEPLLNGFAGGARGGTGIQARVGSGSVWENRTAVQFVGEGGGGEVKQAPKEGAKEAGAKADDNPDAKAVAEFKKGVYKVENHCPSTGRGAFDVCYTPASSALDITVRVDFAFKDDKGKWFNGGGLSGILRDIVNIVKWVQEYQQVVAQRWSNRYVMQCKKKNWESLEANTNVAVKYDPDKPHYKLSVYKEPDGTSYGDSSVNRDPKWTENAPGAYNNFNGARTGKLGSTDTTPNPDWQSPTVRGTEVDRMKSKMPKEVLFTNASDAVSAADRTSLEAFGRALSMTRHPKLTIHLVGRTSNSGSGKSNLDLSRRRADNVLAAIRTGGTIVHDLKTEPKGEAGAGPEDKWRRVELSIDPVDPNWKNQYDVAGHEAGHMLGLADEYPRAGAPAPAHIKLVEEALGKEVAQTFLQREARSASIMSSGLDVRPYHYVTFWEALGRATTPTLTRTDWKIKT